MAGNIENILKSGACISEETMLRYLDGKLSPLESHLVEKHLLECELCSDAFEGLQLIHRSNRKEIISGLNKKIDALNQSSKRVEAKIIPFNNYYRIAAVIALFILFGGSYWYLKNMQQEKMMAQNDSGISKPDSASPQLTPQVNTDQKSSEPTPAQPQKYSEAKNNMSQNTQTILTESKDVPPANEIENALSPIEAAKQKAQEQTATGLITKTETPSDKQSLTKSSAPAAVTASQDAESKAKKEDGMSFKKNSSAGLSGDPASLFKSIKKKYDSKKYSEAADDFEKLLKDSTTKFYDDAEWLLANCYMRVHKNAKARKLLMEIANSNRPHKKEAEGLLQELQ